MAAVTPLTHGAAYAAAPGACLAPSQVLTFADCQAKWYFKHQLGLPDPKTGNLALGIAFHEAAAFALEAKADTGYLPETAEIVDQFSCEWRDVLTETELRDDENPAEIEAAGRGLIEKFMVEDAPGIEPARLPSGDAAIEMEVSGRIAGVNVQGKIDVLERNGRIRDLKTSSKKLSGVTPEHAFQLATYWQLVPDASRLVQIDQFVRTKTPQFVQLPYRIEEADVRATTVMYPLIQETMRAGLYIPNRKSMLCSRRNCPFWRACEKEYGGRVSES